MLKITWSLSGDLVYKHPVCSSERSDHRFPLFAALLECSEQKTMGIVSWFTLYTHRGSIGMLMFNYNCALVCDLYLFSTTVCIHFCLQVFGLQSKFPNEIN